MLREHSDQKLLDSLVKAGLEIPTGLPREIVARGERMVDPLCAILTNRFFNDPEDDDPAGWAPIHALHLLGEIGSASATAGILEWFRTEPITDFITEVGATVLGRLGPDAIAPIVEYVRDSTRDPILRGVAAQGLVEIGFRSPDARPRLVKEILGLFRSHRSAGDEEMAGWLVAACASIDDETVMAAIDAAFEEGIVSLCITHRPDVEHLRSEHQPWSGRASHRDLMAHFSPENLDYLTAINSDESDEGPSPPSAKR